MNYYDSAVNYFGYASQTWKYMQNKGSEIYEEVQKEGKPQECFLAGLRAGVGLIAVSQDLPMTLAGVLLASSFPQVTETGCKLVDGAITGMWNSASLKGRITVVAGGLGLFVIGFPYMSLPCALFAVKVGAEHTIRLQGKEQIATITKQKKIS